VNVTKALAATVEQRIFRIRGQNVMFDSDLAEVYGVTTARLNEQVKRNIERFPADFMFQLKRNEWNNLMSQIATSSWGGARKIPCVYTELGAIMLSSVLRSPRAVQASIVVARAFVYMRCMLLEYKELALRLDKLDRKVTGHDAALGDIISAIKQLMQPSAPPAKRIAGFSGEQP
jgi:hypothetical protein